MPAAAAQLFGASTFVVLGAALAGQRRSVPRHASLHANGLPRKPAECVAFAIGSRRGGRHSAPAAAGDRSPRNPDERPGRTAGAPPFTVAKLSACRIRFPPRGVRLRSRWLRPCGDMRVPALPVGDLFPPGYTLAINNDGVLYRRVLVVVFDHFVCARSVLGPGPPLPRAPHPGICRNASSNGRAPATRGHSGAPLCRRRSDAVRRPRHFFCFRSPAM